MEAQETTELIEQHADGKKNRTALTISIFAMVLAIGVVVDDAIVFAASTHATMTSRLNATPTDSSVGICVNFKRVQRPGSTEKTDD